MTTKKRAVLGALDDLGRLVKSMAGVESEDKLSELVCRADADGERIRAALGLCYGYLVGQMLAGGRTADDLHAEVERAVTRYHELAATVGD